MPPRSRYPPRRHAADKDSGDRRAMAVATVMVDRAIGLWALIALVALTGGAFWLMGHPAVLGQPELRRTVRIALGLLAATLVASAALAVLPERRAQRFGQRLMGIPRVGGTLLELWGAVWMYRTKGRIILVALLMSLAGHTCSVLMFYCVVSAFQPAGGQGNIPSLSEHFLLVPVGMAGQAFIPTPGGVGGGEWLFGKLYEMVGRLNKDGVIGSFGQRVLAWVLGAAGYVVYLTMRKELPRPTPLTTAEVAEALPQPAPEPAKGDRR
ncbi:MAG: lysylphosphatidylglycerol synthase transmembrane domain-containing protein [Gemmataceae bacterium]